MLAFRPDSAEREALSEFYLMPRGGDLNLSSAVASPHDGLEKRDGKMKK
jgi:hypothetical protein